MLIEKTLGKLEDFPLGGRAVETVWLDWHEIGMKILRKTLANGEEAGIRLPEGIQEGDVLYEGEERVIAVGIKQTELIAIACPSARELGLACYELGNRHLPISLSENRVLCPYDEPTREYLLKKGFDVTVVTESFSNFTASGHSHG